MTTESAVKATTLPETICGKDERVRVDSETSPPYKYICNLLITATNRTQYVGSGFKIHVPNINCSLVVTSGHCVYVNGAYASNIRVTFPGQAAVDIQAANLYASPEYIASANDDFDYGIIIMPGNSNEGFGWSSILTDAQILASTVTNCGYPVDKQPWPQMWITVGEVTQVTTNRIFYMSDTGGQSGSPVYTWWKGYWTVIGVHSNGGCPNSAPRFTSQMIYRFLERTQNLKKYSLRSAQFTSVYVRCDGNGVTSATGPGGGVINCQFQPPSNWETFTVYPVEVTPSLAQQQTYVVTLRNVQWTNAQIRADGSGMSKPEGPGGGVVNCQWSGVHVSTWESFYLKEDTASGTYSFRSVQYENCYIRIDGSGVTSPKGSGGGVVNLQYYNATAPSAWERFFMEPK